MKKHYRNHNNCRFRGKEINSIKVSDHCHLRGKYRGTADNKCNINVTQKHVILFHLYFTISVIVIVIYSSKN